jgi:hypothetical protein
MQRGAPGMLAHGLDEPSGGLFTMAAMDAAARCWREMNVHPHGAKHKAAAAIDNLVTRHHRHDG